MSHLKSFNVFAFLAFLTLAVSGCSEPTIQELAERGDATAQYKLGVMYAFGEDVPEDTAEAVKWLRKAAEQGVADAQYCLGIAYTNGEGVPEDDVEAYAWFSVAAANGNAESVEYRDATRNRLTGEQFARAQQRATELSEQCRKP